MPRRNRHREQRRAAQSETPSRSSGSPALVTTAARAEPAAGTRRIADEAGAAALASLLLDPTRGYPVAVISIPSGEVHPRIDATEVAYAVRGLAEVVILPTDASSWRLSELLPPMTQVYGGAGRVYPVGLEWTTDPYLSPLRFCYDGDPVDRATGALVSDCLRMAQAAGVVVDTSTHAVHRHGTVKMLVPPSRALVILDGGELATVWQELTAPDVAVDQLLTEGMAVDGTYDTDTRRLDISPMLLDGSAATADYGVDDVVLTKVTAVRPDVVHLALHPDVVVAVPKDRITDDAEDALTDLFTVGEIVVARVAWHDGTRAALRLDDLGADPLPLPAPALIAGGPPWLVIEPPEPDAIAAASPPVEVPRPAAPVDDVGMVGPTPVQAELQQLRRQIRSLTEDRQRLLEQVAAQRTHLRKRLQTATKALRSTPVAADDDGPQFVDPVAQLRHEIYLEWATRIPAGEKASRPLREHTFGPDFLQSLAEVGGVPRRKVVQVLVEVLTGYAEQLDGRELHPLRSGAGGDDAPVVRADGATCWRVALQRNAPAARRLHYWRTGSTVEFSRVVLHDDMRP